MITVLLSAFLVWQVADQAVEAKPHKVRMVKHQPMDDVGFEKSEVFSELNAIREAIGMPSLQENKQLAKAAQAHADYLVANHISSHQEEKNKKGFTGAKPIDRALAAGYSARFVGENLSTKSRSSHDSLDGLFSAIYHRFGFLNPQFDEVGIGISQDKLHPDNSAFVYLMGNSELERLCHTNSFRGSGSYMAKGCKNLKYRIDARAYKNAKSITSSLSPSIIKYPYDGQDEVPTAFYDETPDPLPDYDVSGFPVSVEFNLPKRKNIKLLSFRLFVKNGDEIKNVRLLDKHSDPQHMLNKYQFALLPLERLYFGTEYLAKVEYTINGEKHTLDWSFATIKPVEELVVLHNKQEEITLKAGKGYWLYFKPHDPHDLLRTMQFPEDVYIRFIDYNTMKVVIDPDRSRGFDIRGGDRRVHVDIE